MKYILLILGLVGLNVWSVRADGTMPYPASQAEVNAGTIRTKFVTPNTLAGFVGTNSLSLLTTNNSMVPISAFGAKGGTNDDTVAFQNALNSRTAVFVDPRTNYTAGTLFLTNGSCLIGQLTVLNFLTNGNVSGPMFQARSASCTNVSVHGFVIDGMSWSFTGGNTGPWTFTGASNIVAAYNIDRLAFYVPAHGTNFDISGNKIQNFGEGVRVFGSLGAFPQPFEVATHFDNISVINCFRAFEWTNSAEYTLSTGLHARHCGFGLWIGSGNVYVMGADMVRNGCAIRVVGTGVSNPAHGEVDGATFNHNDISIWCSDFNNGFLFNGCVILGGGGEGTADLMILTNCSGVYFTGGELNDSDPIIASGSGTNFIKNNLCSGIPPQFVTAPMVLKFSDLTDLNMKTTQVTNNEDGVYTGINTFTSLNGNGSGVTNLASSYSTNITAGATNVNTTQRVQHWSVPVVTTMPAATLGNARIDLQVQRGDGVWETKATSAIAGGATSIIFTNRLILEVDVPAGGSMRNTNTLSGTGYTAGPDATGTNTVTFY